MKRLDFDRYFYKKHLNDEAKALISDAILLHKERMLPVAVRKHIESCPQCKKEVYALYEIMKKDGVIRETEIHPYLDHPMMEEKDPFRVYNLLKIAAALLLFVGLGTLIYYMFIGQRKLVIPNNTMTHNADSINKHGDNKIAKDQTGKVSDTTIAPLKNIHSRHSLHQNALAENMEESALFEGLIVSNYRGNNMKVSFPPLNHTFNSVQAVVFKINGDLSGSLVLILYNNKGEEIIAKNNISNNRLLINNRLSSGLYYWKLLKGRDLIQAGKFFIRK